MMLDGSQLPSSAMCPAVAQAATPITEPVMPTISWQVHFVLCVMLITLSLLKYFRFIYFPLRM